MQYFPIEENINIQTELKFQNTINRNDSSAEQRIIEHKNALRKYTFFKNIITPTEIETLRNFHFSVKGSKDAFLYLDKSDYIANHSGDYSYGCLYPNANGTTKDFQLCKFYFVANNNHFRAITKPIASSIVLKQGANTLTGWTLGDNGKITFANAPSSGLIVAQFSFHVPVRFDSDKIEDKIVVRYPNNQKIFSLEKLTVTEVKITPYLDPNDTINPTINHTFQLDLYKNSITTAQYDTEIESQSSGFEERKQKQEDPLFLFKLQDRRTLQQKDIDYLIALYLCSKGEGCLFSFIDKSTNQTYPARFNNASLNYLNQSANRIYQIQGLELRVFIEGVKADIGHNGWQGNLLTLCQIFQIKVPDLIVAGETERISITAISNSVNTNNRNGANNNQVSGNIISIVRQDGTIESSGQIGKSDKNYIVTVQQTVNYEQFGTNNVIETYTAINQGIVKGEIVGMELYPTNTFGGNFFYGPPVKILRRDLGGIESEDPLAFTTHDRDLTIDGIRYKSDKTMSPSALETKVDLSADNQEIRGIISLEIPEDGIFANRFKNAELISAVIDWRNLPANLDVIPDRDIQYGVIGEIRTNGTYFIFEYLTKAASALRAGRIRKISPNCPYQFTDSDCKVSKNDVTYQTTIGIVRDRRSFFINQLESNLSFGTIKFLSGRNKGITVTIYDVVETNRVILYTLLPFTPQDGDRIEITKGCRKTPNDCKDFGNFINYGGDEDLPGNDFYLSTPIRR